MANAVKWTSATTRAIITDGSCNNGATVAGTLANHTNEDRWMDLQLSVTFGTAPAADTVFTCYAHPKLAGSVSVAGLGVPIGVFAVGNSTSAQVCAPIRGVPISPLEYDITLRNDTGQNATASSVQLTARTYNEEVQ